MTVMSARRTNIDQIEQQWRISCETKNNGATASGLRPAVSMRLGDTSVEFVD